MYAYSVILRPMKVLLLPRCFHVEGKFSFRSSDFIGNGEAGKLLIFNDDQKALFSGWNADKYRNLNV